MLTPNSQPVANDGIPKKAIVTDATGCSTQKLKQLICYLVAV
jgi:hypothetical protein